jgi:hypothetical protein
MEARSSKGTSLGLAAGLLLGLAGGLIAQAPPLGSEFQANGYTTGFQGNPSIAAAPDGRFVVVWESYDQDGAKLGVFGQRFDPLGQPLGTEFAINTYTTGNQRDPSVGMDDADGFVVVWASQRADDTDYGIFGQRFASSGSKVGSEFRVNTYTTNRQDSPKVAVNGDGSFVVVWNDNSRDLSGSAVTGQRFDPSGVKVGSDFPVNTHTDDFQEFPGICADRAGSFVVVWDSRFQDGSSYGIFGQRFDRTAAKVGPEFPVNAYTLGAQIFQTIACDSRGNFVVAWEEYPVINGRSGVFAQRFNSGGERVGSEIPVTDYGMAATFEGPTVAVDAKGNFVVGWHGLANVGTLLPPAIFGKRYDRSGDAIGGIFQIDVHTLSSFAPVIASGLNGDLVVVWTGADSSGAGIISRRTSFSPDDLIVDGFAGKFPTSDVNGVLEPDESVIVAPTWKNVTGEGPTPAGVPLTGAADDLSLIGGGTPSMTLDDASADYGVVLPDQASNCFATSGSGCYRVSLNPEAHAGIHQDLSLRENLSTGGSKDWKLHIGETFSDVPRAQPFYKKIETLLHNGITTGCSAAQYCPDAVVSRDQMAIFIAKGIAGLGELVPSAGQVGASVYVCSSGGHSLFADVAPTDSFCKHVHYLASENVTLGCDATHYCPSQIITRDAMASFIAKAIVAPRGGAAVPATYTDPTTSRSYSCVSGSANLHFADVSVSNAYCKHIHFLWARGIVDGCTATAYCPGSPVARDAMAKFIANGFGLRLDGP